MPTLTIEGKRIQVGDEFLSMSPEEQEATVEEIANDLKIAPSISTQNPPVENTYNQEMRAPVGDEGSSEALRAPQGQGMATVDQNNNQTGVTNTPRAEWDGLADTNMYDGVTSLEEAQDRFEQASADPRNKDRIVPTYRKSLLKGPLEEANRLADLLIPDFLIPENEIDVSVPEMAGGGLVKGLKETAKTIAGAGDMALGALGIDNNGARVIDESIPDMKADPDSSVDSLVMDTAAIAPGSIGAMKATATALASFGKFTRFAGDLISGSVAAGAAMDEDTKTNLVGPNAAFANLFNGIDVDEDGSYSEDMLQKKLNIMVDGIVTGAALGGVTVGVGQAAAFVKNGVWGKALGLFKKSTGENEAFDALLNSAGVATADKARIAQEWKDIMKEYGVKTLSLPSGDSTILELGAMDALIAGLRAKGDDAMANRLLAQREAVHRAGMEGTVEVDNRYRDTLDEVAGEIKTSGGAEEGVERAREGLVRQGLDEVQPYQEAVDVAQENVDTARTNLRDRERTEPLALEQSYADEVRRIATDKKAAQEALTQAEEDIGERIKSDPVFAEELQRLGAETNTNIYRGKNQLNSDIVQKVLRAEDVMSSERDQLWNAVPDSLRIDPQSADEFQFALDDAFNESGKDILPPALRKIQTTNPEKFYSYKFLRNNVLKHVNKTISAALADPKSQLDLDSLFAIQKNITQDMPEALLDAGEFEGLDAFQRAYSHERMYQDFFGGKDKPLAKIRILNGRIYNGDLGSEELFQDKAGAIVNDAFSNKNRGTANTYRRLLETDYGGRDPSILAQAALIEPVEMLRAKVNAGTLSDLDLDSFIGSVSQTREVLDSVAPGKGAQIDKLISDIRKARTNIQTRQGILDESMTAEREALDVANADSKVTLQQSLNLDRDAIEELTTVLDEAKFAASEAERGLLNGELRNFFTREKIPNQDGQLVFEKYFRQEDGLNDMKAIMARVDADPNAEILRKGIQASYGEHILKQSGTWSERTIRDELDRLARFDKLIFSDDPRLAETMEEILGAVRMTTTRETSQQSAVANLPAVLQAQGNTAISRSIGFFVGYLNRTAAMTRNVAGLVVQEANAIDALRRTVGLMHTDKETFYRLADQYIAAQKRGDAYVQKVVNDFTRTLERAESGDEQFIELDPVTVPEDDLERTSTFSSSSTSGYPNRSMDDLTQAEPDETEPEESFPMDDFLAVTRGREPLRNQNRTRFPSGGFVAR